MKKKIKIIRRSLILLILVIGVLYLSIFAFALKASDRITSNTATFAGGYEDAEGFIDANTLNDKEKLVAENSKFKLYLDQTTSHFYVYDKETTEIIESNPRIKEELLPEGKYLNAQLSTLEYRYFNEIGVRSSRLNNYQTSISHPESVQNAEGYRTFKLKEIENGFQVYYRIADTNIDYLFFPKYLEADVFEPILELPRNSEVRRAILNAYWDTPSYVNDVKLYEARTYESMSGTVRKDLYKVFYTEEYFGEYSREKSIEENAKYGYFEEILKFSFDVAVQVTINSEGFEIKLINDSIQEFSTSKLSEIRLYPYFGNGVSHNFETDEENKGYLVIPDGSGAILNFNNGRIDARGYSKKVYGQDLAAMPYKMPETQEKIHIPVYGMIKDKIGFAAIITEGDAMATIGANVSGVNGDPFNRIYTTFDLREYEAYILGSGFNTHGVNLWSKNIAKYDYTISYKVLTNEENSYVGVANAYKQYLIDEKGYTKNENYSNKILIELLGAYDKRKMFLGVPYTSMEHLTNYEQANLIIDEIKELGVSELDVLFQGITNGGLSNNFEDKVKFEKTVGNKKAYEKFESNLASQNINLYSTANFVTTSKYNRLFDANRYSSKRITREISRLFAYDVPTNLPNIEAKIEGSNSHYVINPLYYETLYNKYNKSYSFNSLNLVGIGSSLSSNFIKNKEIYLQESMQIQERLLSNIENKKLMINAPLGFAIPYIETATDVPFESTLYSILDYQIPLMQLVLSDFMNYTSTSINLSSARDADYQFLKALENGSSIKYTLTYSNSLDLLNTKYNQYTSTRYTNWLDMIKEHNDVLQNNNLANAHLVKHERVQNNVFKATYNNGVEVILNYNLVAVNVNGNSINSLGYLIVGGGN